MQSSCSHTVAPAPTTPPVGTAKDTKGRAKGQCPPLGLAPLSIRQQTQQQQGELERVHPLAGCSGWRFPQLVRARNPPPPPDFPVTHLCECVSLQQEGTGLGSAGDLLWSSALQVVELFKTNAAKGARCHAIGDSILLYGIYTLCPSNSLKKAEAK